MSNLCPVTVLYGENKLQRTIKLPASTTVKNAKEAGSREILNHLRVQPGVPSLITLDDDCTDFYPAAAPNVQIGDLKDQATIVVWPKPADGSSYTPSPIMDALSSTTTELAHARAQVSAEALIKEDKQPKKRQKQQKRSPPNPPSSSSDVTNSTLENILSRLANLETNNMELREGNAELRESNAELRESNAELWESNTELRESNAELQGSNATLKHDLEVTNVTLRTTMQAVIGDRIAINKIRNRVLLDIGRDRLAVICGCKDWKDWKANSASRDEIIESASTQLRISRENLPQQWNALCSHPTALRRLLLPNPVRSRGDLAAHMSAKQCIGESVLALADEQERKDMVAIFKTVYGEEPAH